MEITKDKITDIFCIIDDFCEEYDKDIEKMSLKAPDGRRHRKRNESEGTRWTQTP